MPYLYRLVPVGPATQIGNEAVRESTISSVEELGVGDVAPASPGTWTVERIEAAGTTQWASEAVGRDDPQTVPSPITLYCRVEA